MAILKLKDENGNIIDVPAIVGSKGDKGEPFKYEDFTEEQLAALKGADGYTPIKGVDYFDGATGPQGPQGNPGRDGLTTSVNGVQQVNGNITLTASDIGADPSGTAANAVSTHNGESSAHSNLFAKKTDKPTVVESSGAVNVAIADNTEYAFTNVTGLTMTGNTNKAHGFVTFGSSAPSVSVTGFAKSGGDDVAGAKASEIWEFSTDTGYIIWKNWSA